MIAKRCLLLALVLSGSAAARAQTTNPPPAGLAALGFLVGSTWRGDLPSGPDGRTAGLEARFDWTQNHQGIRFDSSWLIGDRKYPYTSGVYLWNPQSKQIAISYSDAEGALTTGTVSLAGAVFEHDLQVIDPSGKIERVRTTLSPSHPAGDTFTNVIYRLKDGHWIQLAEVDYHKLKP